MPRNTHRVVALLVQGQVHLDRDSKGMGGAYALVRGRIQEETDTHRRDLVTSHMSVKLLCNSGHPDTRPQKPAWWKKSPECTTGDSATKRDS